MEKKVLERDDILKSIIETLKPLEYVYGMWQCGSAAFKRVDEWSDVDIIIDVADDKTEEVFKKVDNALETLSPIENSFGVFKTIWQGAYQKVYKLKDTNRFLAIDVCAIQHSSSSKFLEKEIHGDVFVHFDKKNITNIKPIDKIKFAEKLNERVQQLENTFKLFQYLTEKELYRKNYMEALSYYNNFTLNPLVEVLRIRHKPFRYNFKSRYLYYDLPEDVVNRLHDFYFIKDGDELKLRHEEANKWFNEVISQLKTIELVDIL
ncbi:hypothetical protein [Brassicibacter mesophilus]|uniref:hypothetical protein n=1 Tax=Brassicibacter mesophilus TaxID=745119 RepID=UPI003D2557C2